MSTPVGVIKKFVKALTETKNTGTAAADEAFKAVGATSYSAFKSKFNTAKSNLSIDTFLKEQCGIRLTNSDTGAITGSDAGGKIVKTDESIVPETASAKELTAAEYNSFTKNGLKVNVIYKELDDDEVDEEFGYSAATYLAKQKLVVKALYNWWIPESLNLINESFGSNFNDKLANIYKFDVKFEGANDSNYPVELDFDYDNKGYAFEVTLRIDPNLLYNITANDKNGKLPTDYSYDGKYGVVSDSYGSWDDACSATFTSYLDRLILQAMAEVTLKANIPYFYKLPLGIRSGLIELVGGYDSGGDIVANSFYSNNIDEDGQGYAALRYLAKNYSDGMPDGLSYNADKTVLTVTTEFTESKIDLADFESTVKNVNASALKRGIQIVGNALANSIRGGSGNDTLSGGDGNDSIWGGSGNDSLKGGDGNDIFIYSAGNDVISDYVVGQDKIKLSNASIKSASVSGSDLVLTLNSGKITVKGGKDKNITVIDAKGNETTKKYGVSTASTLMTVTNSTTSPVSIGSAFKVVDASTRTTAIKLTGNALANSIKGGSGNDTYSGGDGNDSIYGGDGNDVLYGQAGNDKLYGQAGNDSLYGGAGDDSLSGGNGNDYLKGGDGKDVFIYSAGNDIIADYVAGQDKIKLSNASIKSSTVSGSDVVFTLNTGKITVTGGKDKNITVIDASGKETSKKYGTTSGGKTLTVTKNATLGSDYQNADASKLTKAVKIVGNKSANVILGGSKNDTIYGESGNDSILGNAGNDVLYGGFGSDTLKGGDANDKLFGGAGADKLYGGKGDDTLIGGAGNDSLWGNDGADTFIYSSGSGNDVIFGFESKDTLTLDSMDFTATYKNNVVTISFDEGSVTLKDFGSTKTFHINDETYQISGSKFVKK